MKRSMALLVFALGCAGPAPEPLADRPVEPTPSLPIRDRATPEPVSELTLEQAFRLAEELHPNLALARARVEAAEGRMDQAGRFPNPILVARMESARFEGGTTAEAEYLAGFSQRLPVGGRLESASRVESLERERLRRELEVRGLEVRARVQAAFAAALYAEEVVRLQAEALRIARNGVAITRTRFDAGDALPEEVARVEMEEVRARLEEERAGGLKTIALVSLASAVGDAALRIESLRGSLEAALEIPALESLLEEFEQGPYAALADAEAAVARGRIDLAKVERIPDVSLDLFYRRLEHAEEDAFDVGVGIALPIFDRGRGRIREAEAEAVAARARGRTVRSEAARELREAYVRLTEAVHHARLLKNEILPRAETVLRGAETRYAGGDMSLADVLPIRRERTSVQLTYLEALRDVLEAWGRLKPFLKAP
jgi:cobalt-zinc-cadmium efflux system outer membrane protein